MSPPFLIIDGYNLMHAVGLARATYGPGDLARLRHQLLVKLTCKLSVDERRRCTVVFDAIDAPANLPGRFRHEEMAVLFAQPGHEADELIEELIRQHSAARRLTVVSSDHRLQSAIRRRRGLGIDSEDFLRQLESPSRQLGADPKAVGPASRPEGELDFWMTQFDDIQPEVLSEEIMNPPGEAKDSWEVGIDQLQRRLQDPDDLEKWLGDPGQTKAHRRPKKK